ncbi:hypothetical protein MGWOODY_Smn2580 [hydrothermal vent metagenome]|uniref:Uncharacterized protein n=1 Tax=hydrothermal vent metagenome TaxID=652676 RepID=A0A160THV3_9ZZZZ
MREAAKPPYGPRVPRPRPCHEFSARPARLPYPARDGGRAGIDRRRAARPAPVDRRGVGAGAYAVRRGGRRQPAAQPGRRAARAAAWCAVAPADRMDRQLLSRAASLGGAHGACLRLGPRRRTDGSGISCDR